MMQVSTSPTYLGKTKVTIYNGYYYMSLLFHTRHDAAVFLNAMRKRVKK